MTIQKNSTNIEPQESAAVAARSGVGEIRSRSSQTEREVLRVLWASPDQYFVRSEIHRRMPAASRPTLGRVGQILKSLYQAGFLSRKLRRVQGSRKAAIYALNAVGRERCQQLGFKGEELLLFGMSPAELEGSLRLERLSALPSGSSRILSFCAYRGGIGRSTLVAFLAKGLAEEMDHQKSVLVVDLDLRSPGLDDLFSHKGQASCRGLCGLLVDFRRQDSQKRSLWLRCALGDPEYVARPLEDQLNLFYLPSGFGPASTAVTPAEQAEALNSLRVAAGLSVASTAEERGVDEAFLAELRDALAERFELTLVDPSIGHSLGGWIAGVVLADTMILCMSEADTRPTTVAGLRAILGNYALRGPARRGQAPGFVFLFRTAGFVSRDRLADWVGRNLLAEHASTKPRESIKVERYNTDSRLASHPPDWRLAETVLSTLRSLFPVKDLAEIPPPAYQALTIVLDAERSSGERSIAAGVLVNAPLAQVLAGIDWHDRSTDAQGDRDELAEELVKKIVAHQGNRLKDRILGPGVH